MEIPVGGNDDAFENNFGGKVSGIPMFNDAFNEPENSELDVSLTASTVRQLAGITIVICLVSIAIPSTYVLRLSPREILVKKEG